MPEPVVADPEARPAHPADPDPEGPAPLVRVLSGWGRTVPSAARVSTPGDEAELVAALGSGNGSRRGGVIARGLGRSYGDAAQCGGGLVIETVGLDRIGPIDDETGVVEVDAGVSLAALMTRGLPAGWFVPVTPGTRQVTIGGAIAADIHGKNHHRDGSFCEHVVSATLATPTGVYEISQESDPELFWATAGGMGLTGVVLRARIRMQRVETAWMRVDTERHPNLDAVMDALERVDPIHRYSVAWLDCSATGSHLGRGVLDAGDHAALGELTGRQKEAPLVAPHEARLGLPVVSPVGLVNTLTVTAFNQAWFAKSPTRSGRLRHLGAFFHPLDAVANWNRLFGRRGFVQYQFVVGNEHRRVVQQAIELLQRAGAPCSMAVLKRFGSGDPGPLSFPVPGWTLALDLPIGPPGLRAALRELDELVVAAGGRVYLAKDARLDPETFAAMYPRAGEFQAAARRVDPEGILQSDLSRRLRIRGQPT
jgi:decaprenylphospho-beta-D-ribofuranose 2-oxidase